MRLIDADSLISEENEIAVRLNGPRFLARPLEKYFENLLKQFLNAVVLSCPTIDAAQVVRCKECKYRMHHPESYKTLLCAHEYWGKEFLLAVSDNYFCSFGEREGGVNLTDSPELLEDEDDEGCDVCHNRYQN